jgi:hemerythrin-like domain-containing protein
LLRALPIGLRNRSGRGGTVARQSQRTPGKREGKTNEPELSSREDTGEEKGLLSRIAGVFSSDEPEGPSKATEMLKDDHDRVRGLFREYESQGDRAHQRKRALVDQVSNELEIHAKLEEQIFYQAFRGVRDEKPRDIVRESFEEHLIVKRLVAELAAMEPSDEQYDAKVTVLKELVEHHAKEEEDDLFPAAERQLGDERLRELGREMDALKRELQKTA